MREKVGKSRSTVFFQWLKAPEGRKVGSLKRRVRSQLARWEMKKCTPLWREAHFQVKMYKTLQPRNAFGSWDVGKVHAVVARSTFRSQNVQSTRGSDTFGGSDVASRGRHKGLCTWSKMRNTWGFCSIFNYNHHYTTLHSNTLHSVTLNYTQLHSITLHYTPLHYITLHYTTFHYTTLPSTTLHYTTLHYIAVHYTPLHYITLHYTTFHYTSLHYTTLHSTALQLQLHNYTPLHYATLHYTTLHYTTLHYTEWHCTTDRQVDR